MILATEVSPVSLTPEERQWLAEHPDITLADAQSKPDREADRFPVVSIGASAGRGRIPEQTKLEHLKITEATYDKSA